MVHLLVEGLVDHGAVLQNHLCILDEGLVDVGEGVLHPVHIVAIRVGLVRMGTPGLLAGLRRVDLLHGLVEKVFELERLDEVGVPNHAAVRDAHILVLLHETVNDVLALAQVLGVAVDRRILLHGDLELPAQICRGQGALSIAHLVEAGERGLARVGWQIHRRAVRLHQLGSSVGRLATEDHEVQQRIGAKAVGAVHGGAARLASRIKAWNDGVLSIAHHLRLPVCGDAAHVVVHSGQHWCRLFCHINTGEDLRSLGNAREALCERLWRQVVQVEVDVVLVRAHAAALADLQCHRAAHHVARCEVLGSGCITRHEWLPLAVPQDAALAPATLGEEAACRENARGVELHELEVLHGQSSTACHGTAIPGASVGRSAGLVGPAEAAGGDDGGVGPEAVDGAVLHAECGAADALAIGAHDKVQGEVLHEEEAVELQSHAVEGVQDGMASAVSGGSAPVGLAPFAEFQALAAEGTLVDLALRSPREGQAE
mmetsp:Transcript_131730/g.294772  ORF Transcript_131730/g.294772 Transcript_131730/m.294772 type:complete len:486 (-) Transcript_131730:56-1513(-)